MKRIILISVFNIFIFSGLMAQTPQSRSERRAEREENRIREVQEMLLNKSFVFIPTHAMPLGGGSIHLSYSFDAEIKGDSISSYLPFSEWHIVLITAAETPRSIFPSLLKDIK